MTNAVKNIWVISPSFPPTICGVGAHTVKLIRELSGRTPDCQWTIVTSSQENTGKPVDTTALSLENVVVLPAISSWKGPNFWRQWDLLQSQHPPDMVLVQYTPHLYDHLGLNLDICKSVQQLKQKGIPVFIVAHELYVPLDRSLRHWITGPIQRWMLGQLVASAKGVFVSTVERQVRLQRRYGKQRESIYYVPVTSNIDKVSWSAEERQQLRSQWCKRPKEKLVLFWGKLHSSKLLSWTLGALRVMERSRIPFQAVYVGPDTTLLKDTLEKSFTDIREYVHMTGPLPEADVSGYLQTSDLLLYPLDDGASTRRGAMMAAIQHGTPVMTTIGPATDELMKRCPNMRFARSADDFGNTAVNWIQELSVQGGKGAKEMQQFFERHYSWQQVGDQMLDVLGAVLRDSPNY